MAKGFKFPTPQGFAKGGMCKPKGAKGYAKGGPARGTNIEASDLYDDNGLASVEAGRNVPRETKNPMRSESVQNARAKAGLKKEYNDMYSFNPSRMMKSDVAGAYTKMRQTEDETGEYAKGGKVKRMSEGGKMRSEKTEQAKADRYALDKISESLGASAANKKYADYRRDEAMEDAARTGRQTGYGIGPGLRAMKKGGKVAKHTDEAMDKALIKKMVKPTAMKKAAGGKVAMGKMKGSSKIVKAGYADGGEVETEQMASKATRVKMPRGAKAPMARAKAVPVASRQPMIQPRTPAPSPLGAMGAAPSPLSRVAAGAGAPRMGMKMGGKATKKH